MAGLPSNSGATTGSSSAYAALDPDSASTDELVAQALRGSCPWGKLGLAPHSAREACHRRYLALALRLHPDYDPDKASGHPRALEAFSAVDAAFRAIESL